MSTNASQRLGCDRFFRLLTECGGDAYPFNRLLRAGWLAVGCFHLYRILS